ncbi:MAG: NHLP bacteriocin export ABC transporter permease/ATPase subunit [Oscillospiraceae bacterium]|nr:NHLP bacteriocin export ABC transporter permease/ATPase subunit [Oscillospiraceae bacterium]
MGWFDEQIKQRKQNDNDVFADSFVNIAGAVMGNRISADKRQLAKNAFDEILKFYHVRTHEIPDNIKDRNEQLEYLLRPYGIMRRTVTLSKHWYKDAIGAMLGIRKSDGEVVALIPTGFSGYSYTDTETGKRVKINRKNKGLFEEAIAFYKPLPLKKLGIPDLMRYISETLSLADFVLIGISTLAVTLIGMLSPKLNHLLFSTVIEEGSIRLLLAITVFIICVTLSSLMINAVNQLIMAQINTKMSISVQAATMARVLSLPADFFKNYSSGELSARAQYINSLCDMLVSTFLSTGLTSVFSLVYLSQIFVYAPALVVPSLIITLVTVAFSVISAFVQMKISKQEMELSSKESGMSYALVSGVQKIKLSGAEKRAFARWGNLYAEQVRLQYDPPVFIKINRVISTAISLVGTLVMYFFAVSSGVSAADYYAFNTAYGMVSGAFMSLAGIALTVAQIKPVMDMVKPILDTVPEISEGRQMVTRVSGSIELNNVSFRYNENMPLVVDNLSLKIRPGQYVAIVGATGCGKSTLMRLMLGFETPQKGAVYFDGKDIATLDLKSLRRNIGVVMQNGKLFSGDIFSNITISAPWLTMDDAWRAAELAGIADDIRRMPMGMHTIISEGSGGVSGGQRQRLMIARAIAPKPRILMFDEATSALDNLTQKTVSESLNSLKCTRIVIAHRLSTIKQCDRIIVLDKGKIMEDGKFDELIAKGGYFAELVARQRLDNTAKAGA